MSNNIVQEVESKVVATKKHTISPKEVFFEKSEDWLLTVDNKGIVTSANNSIAIELGISDGSKLIGKSFLDYLSKNSQDLLKDYIELVANSSKPRNLRLDILSQGEEKQTNWSLFSEEQFAGAVFMIGVQRTTDLPFTDSKQLINIIESVPQFNVILDREGKIVYQNHAFADFSREETIGTPFVNYIDEQYVGTVEGAISAAFDDLTDEMVEMRSIRKDGVLAWYEMQFTPVEVVKGKIKEVNINIIDITERVAAKADLERAQGLYKTIVKNLPHAVMLMVDKDLKLLIAEGTDRDGQGFTPDMIGQSIQDTFNTEYLNRFKKPFFDALQGEEQSFEIEQDRRHFQITFVPFLDEMKNVNGVMASSIDITGLKQAQLELEAKTNKLVRSNEDLEHFAYVASHDLQEPLRMIGNFVQLLEKRYKDKVDSRGQTYIQFTVDGVQRMSNLIQDLLVYSRVGRLEGAVEEFNVRKMLDGVIKTVKEELEKREVEIEVKMEPKMIRGIRPQIETVFHGLVQNAIKFSDKATPKVKITGKESESTYEFAVKDNGIGIEKNFHSKVFTIFQKYHAKEEYGGSGIGLALAKKIVLRHGGEIWFDTFVNRGSTFHFTISKTIM